MNKIKIPLLLSLIFLTTSACNSDDSFLEPNSIDGAWHMVRYEHSTNGENVNLILNDIVWSFDEDLKELTVAINLSITTRENYESLYIGIDEGTHNYSIIESDGVLNLTVGDLEFGNIILTENRLTINRRQSEFGNGNDLSSWHFEK